MAIITMNLPENTKNRRRLFPAAYLAATAMLLLPAYSHGQAQGQMGQGQMGQGQPGQGRLGMAGNVPPQAAEGGWRIRPTMSVFETYTDNVTFARDDLKKSDFITQINPGLAVTGVGRRFNFTGQYMMNNLIYAEQSNFTRTRHQLNATATAELIENLLFVDARALMTQQNITLAGPQAIDNVNVTGNRADVRNFSISPYTRHRFQDFATSELRYTRNVTTSSANPLRNSQADMFLAGLTSGTAFTAFNWGLNYSNQTIHFDGSNRTVELERS
ncbi:MAG: TIGR03016 family PEP-CTERM system-associated outer membrane protein, partial [Nitrosospira sp.]